MNNETVVEDVPLEDVLFKFSFRGQEVKIPEPPVQVLEDFYEATEGKGDMESISAFKTMLISCGMDKAFVDLLPPRHLITVGRRLAGAEKKIN